VPVFYAVGEGVIRYDGVGGYTPSEDWIAWIPRRNKLADGRACVVCIHGGGGTANQFANVPGDNVPKGLADHGVPTISIFATAGYSWGNNASKAAVLSAVNFMGTRFGCRTDKFGLYGLSHGATVTLNVQWDPANSAKVVANAISVPAIDVTYLHVNNILGTAPTIEAAYASEGGVSAGLTAHDPKLNAAAIQLVNKKARCWYGELDTIVLPSQVQAFGVATGVECTMMPATGHVADPLKPDEVVRWIAKRCLFI
jgi:hypothetical protein